VVNLEPFYQAVDTHGLGFWLPMASAVVLCALGICVIVSSLLTRRDHPLGMVVGLLAALLVALVPLSLLAAHRAYQDDVVEWLAGHPNAPWWMAAAMFAVVVLTVLFFGMRRKGATHPIDAILGVLIGLLTAIQIPLFLSFLYLFTIYWRPIWGAKLEYVVPITASVLIALSTVGYAICHAQPRAAAANRIYQVVIGVLLVLLAFLAMGNYLSWGQWRYGAFVNAYEFYHYYIGSKYSPEVGYFHMYDATVAADAETGKRFAKSTIRDLTTGKKVETAKVLAEKERYRAMFSEERWQEFLMDIRWFKTKLVPTRFGDMIGDKGYNATPVWTMLVGGILSENISTSDKPPAIVEYPMRAYRAVLTWVLGKDPYPGEPNGMLFLALLDLVLIAVAAGCVVWAFGMRAALLMLIVLGTSYVMKYSHMKGAYLRTDFTMSLIVGVCCLKKEHYALAGSFIAYSFLSRVFPAVFFFGMGAKLAWHAIEALPVFLRRTRTAGAAAAAVLALLGLGVGAAVLGPKVIDKMVLHPEDALPMALPGGMLALLHGTFGVAMAIGLVLAMVILWGWWEGTVPRRYLTFFASATATVAVLVGAAFIYHSAAKPAHHPLNYEDKIGKEGSVGRAIGNMLARHFDGGLTVFGEYKEKIGRHNKDISPWRVGFKYWFIGVGSRRPLWAGWERAEKGETRWVDGDLAKHEEDSFLGGLWREIRGPSDPALLAKPEFARFAESGSLERIRYRAPGKGLWETAHAEMKDNAVITRSAIHTKEKRGIYNLVLLLVLGVSFFLVPALKDHEATVWSFVLVFFLVSATYYYFILLLVPLLFFSPYLQKPTRALGVIMLLMAAWPGYYIYSAFAWKQNFSTYYYHSVMYFILALYMMLLGGGATLRAAGRRIAHWRRMHAA
jgi:hypothetical protein